MQLLSHRKIYQRLSLPPFLASEYTSTPHHDGIRTQPPSSPSCTSSPRTTYHATSASFRSHVRIWRTLGVEHKYFPGSRPATSQYLPLSCISGTIPSPDPVFVNGLQFVSSATRYPRVRNCSDRHCPRFGKFIDRPQSIGNMILSDDLSPQREAEGQASDRST